MRLLGKLRCKMPLYLLYSDARNRAHSSGGRAIDFYQLVQGANLCAPDTFT